MNPEDHEIPICRICHESIGELLAPCRCKGTARFIHRQCLEEWRKINRKSKQKAYRCEICLAHFKFMLLYPSIWSYVKNHWTLFEKAMYSSSLLSSLFSIMVSFLAYRRDNRDSMMLTPKAPLKSIRTLRESFLYGWPPNLKLVMLSCMIIVIIGNCFLYFQWRERNRKEIVLPYDFVKKDTKHFRSFHDGTDDRG